MLRTHDLHGRNAIAPLVRSRLPRPAAWTWIPFALLTAFAGLAAAQQNAVDEKARRAQAAAEAVRLIELQREQAAIDREMQQRLAIEPAIAARMQIETRLSDAQFELWIFQQDRNAAGARQKFDSQLVGQLDAIDRTYKLSDEQRKKLQLAGRGDIKRFFDGFERVKQRFRSLENDARKISEIQEDVNRLRTSLQAGLFQDDSLLYKSLRTTLTAEQIEQYDAKVQGEAQVRRRAAVELVVSLLEKRMRLSDAQRHELIALLMTQARLGQLPEEKLKPLFGDPQGQLVNRYLGQFRGLELGLREGGLLPIEVKGMVPPPVK